jgi:plasmid stability protein
MSSFTIHNLDKPLATLLKARAREQGVSVNQFVKGLLEQALGVKPPPSKNRKHFEKLLGTWSKAEQAEFDRAVAPFERIDESDWR